MARIKGVDIPNPFFIKFPISEELTEKTLSPAFLPDLRF